MRMPGSLMAEGFFFVAILGGCSFPEEQPTVRRIPAPGGALETFDQESRPRRVWAEILDWTGESAICLRAESVDGAVYPIWRKEFFSPEPFQGWVVETFVWSPDGRAAAYQVYSSGGHQPYRSPVEVLSIESGDVVNLEDLVSGAWPEGWWAITADRGGLRWSPEGRLHFHIVRGEEWNVEEFAYDPRTKSLAKVER